MPAVKRVIADDGGNIYATREDAVYLGTAAIYDAATIDAAAGATGVLRRLDAVPQTATSAALLRGMRALAKEVDV